MHNQDKKKYSTMKNQTFRNEVGMRQSGRLTTFDCQLTSMESWVGMKNIAWFIGYNVHTHFVKFCKRDI